MTARITLLMTLVSLLFAANANANTNATITGTVSETCQKEAYVCFNEQYTASNNKFEGQTLGSLAMATFASNAFRVNQYVYGYRSFWGGTKYKFMPRVSSHTAGTFVFSPKLLKWAFYDSRGNLVRTGKASGGRGWCPDVNKPCHTPAGRYTVFKKKGADCVSNTYPLAWGGGAPMPYCMFFHGGYAIHGSYEVPNWNASHGCIRIEPSAARVLHNRYIHNGTRVVVLPY